FSCLSKDADKTSKHHCLMSELGFFGSGPITYEELQKMRDRQQKPCKCSTFSNSCARDVLKAQYYCVRDREKPTHILGYEIGALYRGKLGTVNAGVVARIEIWGSRTYEDWVKIRKIPLVYTNAKSAINIDGKNCNGISKARFGEAWELLAPAEPESTEPEVIEI